MGLAIHLYGLLKMPVGWPPTTYLLLAAVTGGIMDVVCFTGGMHLAASVTLGMAYPTLTAAMESREGLRQGHVLDPFQDGWVRYGIFAALGLAVYWGVLFALQNGWSLMGRTLGRPPFPPCSMWGPSCSFKVLLNRPTRGDQRGVSAYPWS